MQPLPISSRNFIGNKLGYPYKSTLRQASFKFMSLPDHPVEACDPLNDQCIYAALLIRDWILRQLGYDVLRRDVLFTIPTHSRVAYLFMNSLDGCRFFILLHFWYSKSFRRYILMPQTIIMILLAWCAIFCDR